MPPPPKYATGCVSLKLQMVLDKRNDTAIRQRTKIAPGILYLSVFSVSFNCFYDISNTFTIVISVVTHNSYICSLGPSVTKKSLLLGY